MLLALDVATTVGFAFGKPGETPAWGSRSFAGKGGTGEVVGKFRHWLGERCYALKPTLLTFEAPYVPRPQMRVGAGPPPMNPLVLRRLLAMVGTVEAVAWELRIECREATPAEITKFFTGRARWGGREQKKAAVIAACERLGWMVGDNDNAADALALWAMAEDILCPGIRPAALPIFSASSPLEQEGENSRNEERPAAQPARRSKPADDRETSNGRQQQLGNIGPEIQPGRGEIAAKRRRLA